MGVTKVEPRWLYQWGQVHFWESLSIPVVYLPKFELSRMSLKNALKSLKNERSTIRGSWAEYLTDLESENCSKPPKIWSYI